MVICLPLQELTGGVVILQLLGRDNACVWLTLIPYLAASPLRTMHRHSGSDFTTLASCVQQLVAGVLAFPVMKLRHGAKPTMAELQLLELVWADAHTMNTATKADVRVTLNSLEAIGNIGWRQLVWFRTGIDVHLYIGRKGARRSKIQRWRMLCWWEQICKLVVGDQLFLLF